MRLALPGALAAICFLPVLTSARPLVPILNAKQVTHRCEHFLKRIEPAVRRMASRSAPSGIFEEWNALQIKVEDLYGPVYLLANAHTDDATRKAADACVLKITRFSTELFQNEKLFRRVQTASTKNSRQVKLQKDLLEGFEDNGVTLPVEKRKRVKEIFEKVEALRQQFERNVSDDEGVAIVKPEEMQGLPKSYIAAQRQDEHGNYVLGLEYPAYASFMGNAKNEGARKRYWIVKTNQGGAANLPILDEIEALRHELARLYDLPSYAVYAIRRKMAESPEKVYKFLDDVKAVVLPLESSELAEMLALKAREHGAPLDQTLLGYWDIPYYEEQIKKTRYHMDQEALRQYFPTEKAVAYVMLVANKLYGINFKEVKVPVWHPAVKYYDVLDARTGKFISGLYLDLYPREGKYAHAAAFPIFGTSRLAHRTPLAALLTNFSSKGLDHHEFETLLHEFGHLMHTVLSQADYAPQAGTNVMGDFVEAPSQMFEEWARREQTLALFKVVCPLCPQLSSDQIGRLDEARKVGRGVFYARQWLLAMYDMALSSEKPEPVMPLWKRMEGATPLGYVEGTMFPAGFEHIADGYGAGYYGYMWSQVLALDMLSAFDGNLLDPKVGKRYRDTILAQGGQAHPEKLVRNFLGREPDSRAFFAEITGTR